MLLNSVVLATLITFGVLALYAYARWYAAQIRKRIERSVYRGLTR